MFGIAGDDKSNQQRSKNKTNYKTDELIVQENVRDKNIDIQRD